MSQLKVIISGGGTGGHVFPAIAIADALKERIPDCQILFVGADNRLEMEKVPQAGYNIKGLPIRSFQRKITFKNINTIFRLLKSIKLSKKIIDDFKPNVVVGVGGYASAPVLRVAQKRKMPTLIQEQNSYPGITNKLLAKKANIICVAYPNMDKFFASDKIVFTGNPLRNFKQGVETRKNALDFFGLKDNKKTIFLTGGSLGAKTLNESIIKNIKQLIDADVQLIWQTGKYYFNKAKEFYDGLQVKNGIVITEFVARMDLAYKAADLVIARAGAITISELALLKKPVIFVPSPNVAEDHQTKNAMALVDINAAEIVNDNQSKNLLIRVALEIIFNENKLLKMSTNISNYAKPDAVNEIVDKILQIKK
jgi:UDP-N-acetylglucosamine--N-acetylmuramyl-(pentapeptide) pyrophosphoryl-undecaprenol N-acetylglucosamine transferase